MPQLSHPKRSEQLPENSMPPEERLYLSMPEMPQALLVVEVGHLD